MLKQINNMSKVVGRSNLNYKWLHTTTPCLNDGNMKMEKTINQVTLLGRAGNEPQKRGSEQHPVVTFSLATHNNYKYNTGDMLQRTDWHRISVFRPNLRDTVYNYLKKGQRVYVTGRLTYGEIKMDDGQVRMTSTIIAEDVIFFQHPANSVDV